MAYWITVITKYRFESEEDAPDFEDLDPEEADYTEIVTETDDD